MKQVLRKTAKWILLSIFITITVIGLLAFIPVIEKDFVQAFLEGALTVDKTINLVISFTVVVLLYLVFNYLGIITDFKMNTVFECSIRERFLANYLARGARHYTEEEKDSVIQAMTTELNQLSSEALESVLNIVTSFLSVAVYSVVIFVWFDPLIAIVVMTFGTLGCIASFYVRTDTSAKRDRWLQENQRYIGFLRQILNGLSMVRGNNVHSVNAKNREVAGAVASKCMIFGHAKSLLMCMNNGIAYMFQLLFFVAVVLLAQHDRIQVAAAIVSFTYVALIAEQIEGIFYCIGNLKTIRGLKDKFVQALAEPERIQYDQTPIYSIQAEELTFSADDKKILSPQTVRFTDSEHALIVGVNGSGKSTFLKLVNGMIPPTSGRILINDTPVTDDISYEDMYYIEQDVVVFPTTFAENVTFFGAYNIQDLESFDFYQTPFAQKIINAPDCQLLSGGEKQFLGICRAVISGAKWLLLDESFANISKHLERDMLMELMQKGFHIIYITHGDMHPDLFKKVVQITAPARQLENENA